MSRARRYHHLDPRGGRKSWRAENRRDFDAPDDGHARRHPHRACGAGTFSAARPRATRISPGSAATCTLLAPSSSVAIGFTTDRRSSGCPKRSLGLFRASCVPAALATASSPGRRDDRAGEAFPRALRTAPWSPRAMCAVPREDQAALRRKAKARVDARALTSYTATYKNARERARPSTREPSTSERPPRFIHAAQPTKARATGPNGWLASTSQPPVRGEKAGRSPLLCATLFQVARATRTYRPWMSNCSRW